jgi:hypothetical protein
MSFFKNDSECGDHVTRASVTQAREFRSDFSYGGKVGKREWTKEECQADTEARSEKRYTTIVDACDFAYKRGFNVDEWVNALATLKASAIGSFDIDTLAQGIDGICRNLKGAWEIIAPLAEYQQAVDTVLKNCQGLDQ